VEASYLLLALLYIRLALISLLRGTTWISFRNGMLWGAASHPPDPHVIFSIGEGDSWHFGPWACHVLNACMC